MLMNNKRIEKVIRYLEQKGYNLSLAQWIEQRPSKPWVGSSNLSGEANIARVMELVDITDLKSVGSDCRAGSSPAASTIYKGGICGMD